MSLSPYLNQLLEAYDLERLQALANWLDQDSTDLLNDSPYPVKEESPMSVIHLEKSNLEAQDSTSIEIDDLVAFSILNEFGPDVMGKPYFDWLNRCVSQRFASKAS